MMCVYEYLQKKDHHEISKEDQISDDDRQMINSRMYPLSHRGIGAVISFSVYDSRLSSKPVGLLCETTDALAFAKKYIGTVVQLLSGSNAMQVDKGIFVLLYLSDEIKTTVTMLDLEKQVEGPNGAFQASQLIEIISSVAATHPDPSLRFFSYKLVEKFLNFGDEETRVFLLRELLETCPFHCMKTAAIGLLKEQINQAFAKGVSVFTSPLIVKVFFPLVFQCDWNEEAFWDDYAHVMQALNLYFYLLIKDRPHNLTTVWSTENIKSMQKNYLNPLTHLLDTLKPNKEIECQDMQVDMMRNVVSKILAIVSD
ncbi:uncharacterized protein EV154DRAFT_33378 [Mucor mucedo]|uniref:uncharacterized protein n=1 Tax=Mucor mucedo TaxID=29922 RepID=UPI002220A595|nr:uncharacterized protein EV154DRAFT_33378 [Mucor mucedo]KAI7882308.1 hypothetical protein EV154DRAFT_33378 [Mucor mucedo]